MTEKPHRPAHPWLAVAVGVAVVAWSWWTIQTGRYAGLPADIIGQLLTDLFLAGLALLSRILTRRRFPRAGIKVEITITDDKSDAVRIERMV